MYTIDYLCKIDVLLSHLIMVGVKREKESRKRNPSSSYCCQEYPTTFPRDHTEENIDGIKNYV